MTNEVNRTTLMGLWINHSGILITSYSSMKTDFVGIEHLRQSESKSFFF